MTTETYIISGMTCEHCVSTVTEGISRLGGVTAVRVDLVAGGDSRVTVNSTAALSERAVRAAVEEAGYELAGASPSTPNPTTTRRPR